MLHRAHASWVITLSFVVAFCLAVVPMPIGAAMYRPEWVAMVLIYWVMALPYRMGVGIAWCIGLFVDVLEGSLLGLNAMALCILAYITLSLHQRLRMFSAWQQSAMVLALVGINQLLCHWVQKATSQTTAPNLMFLVAAIASAFVWPWLFLLLRKARRTYRVT